MPFEKLGLIYLDRIKPWHSPPSSPVHKDKIERHFHLAYMREGRRMIKVRHQDALLEAGELLDGVRELVHFSGASGVDE
ncbi:MAG: hypothetical protein H5T33_01835 [Candidatus Methanosuratus sp.]|nr:hypothetical protein [Candidatus Methanosuratincola sp.]